MGVKTIAHDAACTAYREQHRVLRVLVRYARVHYCLKTRAGETRTDERGRNTP